MISAVARRQVARITTVTSYQATKLPKAQHDLAKPYALDPRSAVLNPLESGWCFSRAGRVFFPADFGHRVGHFC